MPPLLNATSFMVEGKENQAQKAQGKTTIASSGIRDSEKDGFGFGGPSSTSKDSTSPAMLASLDLPDEAPGGQPLDLTGNSSRQRSALQSEPPRTLIVQTGAQSQKQKKIEEPSAPSSAGQEKYGSQAFVVSPISPELESPRDLEKLSLGQQSPYPAPSHHSSARCTSTADMDGDDMAEDEDPARHAMKILIFLSTLAPALSLATCLYSFIATLLILLLSPFCLCTTSNRIQRNFQRFLVPPLILQLKAIYSDFDDQEPSRRSKPLMLVIVNLLAPVYAIGICMAAWIAAGFWFFAAILGDPNIKDKTERGKDDDGRTAVMTVRLWWERWLIRGLR